MSYPQSFLNSLFVFEVEAALHYLRIFIAFRKRLTATEGTNPLGGPDLGAEDQGQDPNHTRESHAAPL